MIELSEVEILARRIENAAKLANPIKELFKIADEVRKMDELEVSEPTEYDWDMLELMEQVIDAINDLRGRVTILERDNNG